MRQLEKQVKIKSPARENKILEDTRLFPPPYQKHRHTHTHTHPMAMYFLKKLISQFAILTQEGALELKIMYIFPNPRNE